MFGQNAIITQKHYRNQQKLIVTSIFHSIQGEGPFQGHPATFVRLTGCMFQCKFCDTLFETGDEFAIDELTEEIYSARRRFEITSSAPKARLPLVVITGGEPALQPMLSELIMVLREQGYRVQIESTGNVYRDLDVGELVENPCYLVVSPKVNETTGNFMRLNNKMLERANSLKFVVSSDKFGYTDVPEFALRWRDAKPNRSIYVSPMNVYVDKPQTLTEAEDLLGRSINERVSFWQPGLFDMVANQRNHAHAAYLAMKYDVLLTLQQHLFCNLA